MKQDHRSLLLSAEKDQIHIAIENKSWSIITETFPLEDKLGTSKDKTANTIKISAKSKVILKKYQVQTAKKIILTFDENIPQILIQNFVNEAVRNYTL